MITLFSFLRPDQPKLSPIRKKKYFDNTNVTKTTLVVIALVIAAR